MPRAQRGPSRSTFYILLSEYKASILPYTLSYLLDAILLQLPSTDKETVQKRDKHSHLSHRSPGRNSCFVSSCQPRVALPFQARGASHLVKRFQCWDRGAKGPQPGPTGHRLEAGFWEGSGCPSYKPVAPNPPSKAIALSHIAPHGIVSES